jgi:hypothetical protein
VPVLRKVTDELSEEAKRLMNRGFVEGRSAKVIANWIRSATKESAAERTIQRRRQEWQAETDRRKLARERMDDLLAASESRGMRTSDAIVALARERLEQDPDALTGRDPLKVQGLALAAEEVDLKRRALDIRDRKLKIDERKMALYEERETRARAAVDDLAEHKITPEEMAAKIREVYGLHR